MWDEVGRVVDRLYWSRPGRLLEIVTQWLDGAADAVSAGLALVPLALWALVVGLLLWRSRGLMAGVLAAISIGLLGLSRLLPLTLQTVAVALIATVLAGLVAAVLTLLTVRVRRGGHLAVLPGTGAALAIGTTVVLLPIAEPLAGRGTSPAWIATVGLIAGLLVTPAFAAAPERPRSHRLVALVVTTVAVSLLGGLVGGWGLGGALGRALAGSDLPAVLDASASVLLVMLVLGSVVIDLRRGRTTREVSHDTEPSVTEADADTTAQREAAR